MKRNEYSFDKTDFNRSRAVIPTERERLRIARFLVFFLFISFLHCSLGDVMGDFQSQPRSQPSFMEATISVICNKFKVLKNGESPIMVRVAKDGKRSMKSLGVSINPIYWDFSKNSPNQNLAKFRKTSQGSVPLLCLNSMKR